MLDDIMILDTRFEVLGRLDALVEKFEAIDDDKSSQEQYCVPPNGP